jgi:parallel beta-helix repeat protein
MAEIISQDVSQRLKRSLGHYTDLTSLTSQLAEIVTLAPKPNGVDDTSSLQAILNKGGHILIPDGTYLINSVNTSGNNDKPNGGLNISSNTIVELSPKAVLQVIPNNSQTYSVFRVQDVSNVIIRGGTIKGDRSSHTVSPLWQASHAYAVNDQVNANGYVLKCVTSGTSGTTSPIGVSGSIADGSVTWNYVYDGEWGYGICLNGATNVSIEDIFIQDCWGDGIFVDAGVVSDATPSKNVKIKGVTCNNNRRQGMSTQHVDGLFVSHSTFSNTNGTLPQAGVDLEPYGSYTSKHAIFNSCSFTGNAGDGISFLQYATNSSITECAVNNNKGNGIYCYNTNDIVIQNNIIDSNSIAGIGINKCSYILVLGNQCQLNGVDGIHLYNNSPNNKISGNYVKWNLYNGIKLEGTSNNCDITGNYCIENNKKNNASYTYNLHLFQCSYCNIQNNTLRAGTQSWTPQRGLFIEDSASTSNLVSNNDCYQGGSVSGIFNTGTSTLYGAGNRNKDGTFSTTLN